MLKRLAFCAALGGLLAAAWLAYRPGLSGDFLFDDFGNLPAIGATGPVDHWATFWRYLTSGSNDPAGRPLTLLTFLIDARDWPADPHPFKVTNLLLHLLNGALLCAVLLRLGRALTMRPRQCNPGSRIVIPGLTADFRGQNPESASAASDTGREKRIPGSIADEPGDGPGMTKEEPYPDTAHVRNDERKSQRGQLRKDERKVQEQAWSDTVFRLAALFGAGAWLLHPLFVSTTLYVVQREAMLPATFTLLGMLGWMAARDALANGKTARGLAGMALAAGGCTLLAVLGKGNGVLLPLLLLLVEWIVLAPALPMPSARQERLRRIAVGVLLILPSLLLLGWLLAQLPSSVHFAHSMREWSVPQRLLSEARALVEYLGLLWLPRAYSRGLFTDGFAASTGMLHPWTTLPCVAIVFALIAGAFALRKQHPAIALAILFYFAGQLIESTWLSLELYYEHRNYLPALLMFWPLGLGLFSSVRYRRFGAIAAVAILCLLAALTGFRASLWGDAYAQALVWAQHNPDSARAQTNAAQYEMAHDRPQQAFQLLQRVLSQSPNDIQIPVNLLGAECQMGGAHPETLKALNDTIVRIRAGGQLTFNWFQDALGMATNHSCNGLDFAALQAMLDAGRTNPHWQSVPGRQQDIDHMQGLLDLAQEQPQAALQAFDRAIAHEPRPDAALEQAATLGSRGYPQLGLDHLDYFATLPPAPKPAIGMPRIHAWVLQRQGYWQHETARLRATLQADAAADAAKTKVSAKSPARG